MAALKRCVTLSTVGVIILSLILGGCASKYGTQTTKAYYYQECYQPIQQLRDAEKKLNRTVVGSAVAGALLGAVIGAVTTGKIAGALAGAAGGALAGGALGYAAAKQNSIADDNKRMASYMADLDGDISGLNSVTAAASVARQCYDKQFTAAVEEFKQGRMSKEELDARFAEIKSGSQEASAILGTVITGVSEKEKQYQSAIYSEAKRSNQPVPVVEATPAPAPKEEATTEPPKKKVSKKLKKKAQEPANAQPVVQPAPQPQEKTQVADSGNSLTNLSKKTQAFSQSKASAEQEKNGMNEMQQRWDREMAALQS